MEERAKRFQRAAQALTRRAARRRPARDGGGLQLRAFVQNDVHAGVFQLAVKVAQLAFQRVDLRVDVLKLRIQRLQFLAVRRGGDQLVEAVLFQAQRFQTALRVIVVGGNVLAVDGPVGHFGDKVQRLQKGVQLSGGHVGGDGGAARAVLAAERVGDDMAVVFLHQSLMD